MFKNIFAISYYTAMIASTYFGIYKNVNGMQNILIVLTFVLLFANFSFYTVNGRAKILSMNLTLASYIRYLILMTIGLIMIYHSWWILGLALFLTELMELISRELNGTEANIKTKK